MDILSRRAPIYESPDALDNYRSKTGARSQGAEIRMTGNPLTLGIPREMTSDPWFDRLPIVT